MEGGTYTVTISGFPADASFDVTSAEVTIADDGQSVTRNFSGSYIRTASIMGMVTVEGTGLPGVTVSLSGRQDAEMLTDANGQYTFTGLRAGNYTIEISGFDPTDVAFSSAENTASVTVGESKVIPGFDGVYVRESTIMGQVSVMDMGGLKDVTVSLQGMGEEMEAMTDDGGQYTFDNLRAGDYAVAISGWDAREYGFETTSANIRVEHGRTANVPFEGIMLRTASIMGQVSIEGEGLADVTVSLSGEGESQTAMTDESGQYTFSDLPAGNFAVGISGYDTDDYSFETTSKNVALALGETATVPFEGILLRTSGISGRVSVEGEGLDSVTVTLSGDDLDEDMETMTDASGQYAIAGLAEGDYTVAISGYDDVSYIFDMTSMDVELGDDDVQIVNFSGMHARTASVTVRMFVDELHNNDTHDEGEHAFPSADMLMGVDPENLPVLLAGLNSLVTLAGPGVHDTNMGQVNPQDGSFVFAGLKAGDYQLMVNDIPAELLAAMPQLQDYVYGGPAAGYPIALAVGDEAAQNVPIDITHTTVHFGVSLKHGDETGAALGGATVTLYRDMAGTLKIDDAMTSDDGAASIRIARAGTTGNTVFASVAAPEGNYATSGAMQAVTWNPQYPATMATNDEDIVNTMANFSFSGATITTEYGGGMPLGGWNVSVTTGEDDDAEAVEGAPTELEADGSATFSETVAADDLPKTYMISVAEKQATDSTGTNGEQFTSTTLSHTHDGLSLSGTATDAGTMEVTYTTQRIRVYVHQENDQVMGFTGNVLGGDVRMGGIIDVGIEYIAANGRARSFSKAEGDTIYSGAAGGVYQFWNVPADRNVIVTADEFATLGEDEDGEPIANTAHLLDKNGHSDEVAAYTDMEENGIMGGAFGAHGGFHHTVDLCPLMSHEGDQRHGECSTFAFVETYAVDGQMWMWVRNKSGDDFADSNSKAGVKGQTVSMDPVEGENLAGVDESFTAKTAGSLKFDFNRMPGGVYKVTAPDGWTAQRGPLESPTDDLEERLNPLDSTVNIDVTPETGYVYGTVEDGENRRLAGVTVNVNGMSTTTDSNGRYVVHGFEKANCRLTSGALRRNVTCVTTAHEESEETSQAVGFRANMPVRHDVTIEDAAEVTTISGRVTHSDGGGGVGRVYVWVDGKAPINKNAKFGKTTKNNAYWTDGDGNFTVRIPAKEGGASATVTVQKDGMFFSPDQHTVGAVSGATISGINFTAFNNGTIHGRVVDEKNNPIGGVLVTATQVGGEAMDTMTTTANTGSYSLSVRYGQYSVKAEKAGYTITDTTGVNVPNDGKAQNDLVGTVIANYSLLSSLSLSGVGTLCRGEQPCGRMMGGFESGHENYTATVGNSTDMTTVTATPGGGAKVKPGNIYPEDADSDVAGHQVELAVGDTEIEIKVHSSDDEDSTTYNVTVTRRATSTIITGTITDAEPDDEGNTVGVSGVKVYVDGGNLLNGSRIGTGQLFVSTNSMGEYTAIVESVGEGTVRPVKSGYTFEPGTRDVVLNADSVEGIDFVGSAYATITGTVMANGAALEGATVTATSSGGGKPGSDTTDRRGRFTVRVPAGTITITATKDGYDIGTLTVFADAGETTAVGTINVTGNMTPLNVEVTRDTVTTAPTGLYDGMVTVTWDEGVSGAADAYQAQRLGDDGTTWAAFGGLVLGSDLTAGAGTATADAAGSDTLTVTVRVLALIDTDTAVANTVYGDSLASVVATVGPVDPVPDSVTAHRDIEVDPDSIIVSWKAGGDTNSQWRVLVRFGEDTDWYVFTAEDQIGNRADGGYRVHRFANNTDEHGTLDGTGTGKTFDDAAAALAAYNGALEFMVQYRQRTLRGDDATAVEWKDGAKSTVAAKN